MKERAIAHINIVGFKSAVAASKDKSLKGRPFVIAGSSGGRSLALDCSPEAVRQGVLPGMALAIAEKRIKDLLVLPPDVPSYEAMNNELEKIASMFAPVWENDRAGNLYLDITGTSKIFGVPVDCSSKVLRELKELTDLRPAAAVASNKLVSKVATRTIRPTGLIQVRNGNEAEFMYHQDIAILPGMGAGLLRTASVVGMREIGDIASLSVANAIALFGKGGAILRNMALGIDGSTVQGRSGEKRIIHQADFNEDVIDGTAIRGAIVALAESTGLEMRKEKLGTKNIILLIAYSDGVKIEGKEKLKRLCFLDKDISAYAEKIYRRIAERRIRIRSLGLVLDALAPIGYEVDLFEPETDIKNTRLQNAVDEIQNRFGAGKLTTGLVLAATNKKNGNTKALISPAVYG